MKTAILIRGLFTTGFILLFGCATNAPQDSELPRAHSVDAGPVSKSISVAKHEQLAASLTRQGRLAEARIQTRILRTIYPDNPAYERQERRLRDLIRAKAAEYLRSGYSALSNGDTRLARVKFLSVLAIDPANPDAMEQLRQIDFDRMWRLQSAKLDKLRQSTDRSSASSMDQERFYFELATMLFRQGDYIEAIREMQKYLNSYPRDQQAQQMIASSYEGLARAQRDNGDLEEAVKSFEQGRRYQKDAFDRPTPEEIAVRNSLAEQYYEKGLEMNDVNLSDAIQAYKRVLDLNPNHTEAKNRLKEIQDARRNAPPVKR